ncbi:hypothetical protein PT078_07535 [Erysipelothrix rhusiopathiae]|nr:hypothetical protein [Erysipelothrix rhusiopathiae]
MKKQNKKRTLTLAGKVILYGFILTLTYLTVQSLELAKKERKVLESKIQFINQEMVRLDKQQIENKTKIETIKHISNVGAEVSSVRVYITEYGTWDGESTNNTASGLAIEDFTVSDGIYQYQGKDVLATANSTRWSERLKDGFKSYDLYETVSYELNGVLRTGIVLDVCGACHGVDGEELQRIDVFTEKPIIGKKEGKVYE